MSDDFHSHADVYDAFLLAKWKLEEFPKSNARQPSVWSRVQTAILKSEVPEVEDVLHLRVAVLRVIDASLKGVLDVVLPDKAPLASVQRLLQLWFHHASTNQSDKDLLVEDVTTRYNQRRASHQRDDRSEAGSDGGARRRLELLSPDAHIPDPVVAGGAVAPGAPAAPAQPAPFPVPNQLAPTQLAREVPPAIHPIYQTSHPANQLAPDDRVKSTHPQMQAPLSYPTPTTYAQHVGLIQVLIPEEILLDCRRWHGQDPYKLYTQLQAHMRERTKPGRPLTELNEILHDWLPGDIGMVLNSTFGSPGWYAVVQSVEERIVAMKRKQLLSSRGLACATVFAEEVALHRTNLPAVAKAAHVAVSRTNFRAPAHPGVNGNSGSNTEEQH